MLFSIVACSKSSGYKDGTYEGTASGMHGDVIVSVVVKDGKISSVEVVSQQEDPEIGMAAINELPNKMVEKNSADVDLVSGSTVTSKALIDATKDALAKAK